MRSVAILQARTNSKRLPGKVLLPVGGIPMAVLAAKRAGNKGRHIIVATSSECTDDVLAKVVVSNGLDCYRGNLNNTLCRVVNALDSYDDRTLVFRLTADNVFPDGQLLDEIEKEFLEKKLDYICCNGEPSGFPYGVSVELTRLGHLREALKLTNSLFDMEHVTPFIRRKFGDKFFEKYKIIKKGHYRSTVDCFDDYVGIAKVFSLIEDPVNVPLLELIKILERSNYQPLCEKPVPKFVLGTAQLGLNYGISNTDGKPSKKLAAELIKTAIANGVIYLDTARAYGDSEETIGSVLKSGWQGRVKIITKLSPLTKCPGDASRKTVESLVEASVYKSCYFLGMPQLDVLMLHRASHFRDWNGAVWDCLNRLKDEGLIKELGVSVQHPDELDIFLGNSAIRYIQLPYNILDWRWDVAIPKILRAKKERPLVVHVRSSLLQGLLTSKSERHWRKAKVVDPTQVIAWLENLNDRNATKNVAELCLKYCFSLAWIDGVVVGVENMSQLLENITVFSKDGLSLSEVDKIMECRPRV